MADLKAMDKYKDIIELDYPSIKGYARISKADRAAQFSSFAALSGHSEIIEETGRFTASRIELDEGEKQVINDRLCILLNGIDDKPEIELTYFVEDSLKAGGKYIVEKGRAIKLNNGYLFMENGNKIMLNDISRIQGKLFDLYE